MMFAMPVRQGLESLIARTFARTATTTRTPNREELVEFFDAQAHMHDAWRAKQPLYYREQLAMLRRLVEPGKRVLEIGCATGDTLAALEPSVGVGIDLSPRMVELARQKHPHLRFETADIEDLDLGGEAFDFVLLVDVVGELSDLWAAFRNLRPLCHSSTRIIVTYFNFLWEPVAEVATAVGMKRPQALQNWFSLSDIENLLELNGFETVTTGDRVLLPLEVPMVSELGNRVVAPMPFVHNLNLVQYLVARPGPTFAAKADALSVSVIIPAKNERGNVRAAIQRTPTMGKGTEIIFVEGGSTDGTREEILRAIEDEPTENTVRFIPQTGKGKGDAVRTGFEAAKGDVLMILDADLTVQPEDLPRFFLAIAERRGELVNGCRLVYQMEDQAMRHLNLIANKFFGSAFSWVMNQRVKDTLCGTKVMRKTDYERIVAGRHVFGDFDPFGDFDLLFGAARLGLKIAEMPVRYKARTYGETQIHRFRHGMLLFAMLGKGIRFFKMDP